MSPDEHTIQEHFVDVGNGHQLYVHEWGTKGATPFIFLHGGPGGHTKDGHKRLFDPKRHHVVFFDQRGGGKSLPYGSLEHNTTDNTVEDINTIAKRLKLQQFVLVGSSWGSCLALTYAIKHPAKVAAVVVQGIFTASKAEVDWITKGHFRTFYPEVWEQYLARTPQKHQHDPSAYHLKSILSKNEEAALESAYALSDMEHSIMTLDDRPHHIDPLEFDPTSTKMFAHYVTNNCFLPERHILNNAHKLTMPVWIVQGRYDMDCPPATAYELHNQLPDGRLIWTIANHRGAEHETHTALRTILLQWGG